MKKVLSASLLAAAVSFSAAAHAQQGVTLQGPEYDAYQSAESQQDPASKAASLETFLNTYPNTAVKNAVLEEMLIAYQQSNNPAKAISAADRLLQVDPSNLRALGTEAYYKRTMALQKSPPDQAMLDQAADASQKGLSASKPAAMSQADFDKLQAAFKPIFEDAIGVDDFQKKSYDDAITALKAALAAYPADQATKGPALQDTYLLAQAYAGKGDALSAAYYFARVSALAPAFTEAQKSAAYWYRKYHGKDDGFDAFKAQAAQSATPPATLASTVTPAPKPADIANQLVTSTTDYTTLNIGDTIFILQNASQENADKVFASFKGKSTEFQGTVISATADSVQLAVSDDAQASKTADTTIKMAEPLKTIPTVGAQETYIGTYDSYTRSPFMLNVVDGKSPEKPKAPAKRTPARRR